MGLYSHYDGAHNHPVNRALHMIAIPLGFSFVDRGLVALDGGAATGPGGVCASLARPSDRGEQAGVSYQPCPRLCRAAVDGAKNLRDEYEEDGAVAVRIPSQPVGTHISPIPLAHA